MSFFDEDMEFSRVVNEGLVPRLEGSAVCISLVPPDQKVDAKFCLELGVMIMLDKPIIAVRTGDAEIPPKLRQIAEVVVEEDITTPEGQAQIAAAIKEFATRYGLEPEEKSEHLRDR